MTPPLKIGITGNIGSGKSIVSAILRTIGIPVYDCDTEAKKLMQKDPHTRRKIVETFGEECYTNNQQLNKKHLSDIIFNDTTALQKINNIVHPRVKEDFTEWSKKQKNPTVAIESAILFEAGLHKSIDITIAIYADKDICISRAVRRSNTTRKEIEQRLDEQLPAATIIKKSNYSICNNPDTPILPQINKLLTEITAKQTKQ